MPQRRLSSPIAWGLLAMGAGIIGLWAVSGSSSDSATSSGSSTSSVSTVSTRADAADRRPVSTTAVDAAPTETSGTTEASATTDESTATSVPAEATSPAAADVLSALCRTVPVVADPELGTIATVAEIRVAAQARLDVITRHRAVVATMALPEPQEPARAELLAHLDAARALLAPTAEWPDGPAPDPGSEPYVRVATSDNEMARYLIAAGLLGASACSQPGG